MPWRAAAPRSTRTSRYRPPRARSAKTEFVPATWGRTDSTCRPIRSSTARSGPKILIPTGVLIPVASMSSRLRIGIDHMLATPGVCTLRFISAWMESKVTPGRHWSSGFRMAIDSIMDIGAMSVAVSARPTLPSTISTSGMEAIAASRCWRICFACAVPTPGNMEGMSMIAPSFSGGMNSLPSPRQGTIVTRSAAVAAPITGQRKRSTNRISGR